RRPAEALVAEASPEALAARLRACAAALASGKAGARGRGTGQGRRGAEAAPGGCAGGHRAPGPGARGRRRGRRGPRRCARRGAGAAARGEGEAAAAADDFDRAAALKEAAEVLVSCCRAQETLRPSAEGQVVMLSGLRFAKTAQRRAHGCHARQRECKRPR
ncbi:unnamed protein product, partial [Prorocentrum cordatum]